MIPIRTESEQQKLRTAGKALVDVFKAVAPLIKAGTTTFEINRVAEEVMTALGAEMPCKGYHGYPAAICTSINEVVVHGIPSMRVLTEGDIVSVDIVLKLNGYCADATRTYAVGKVDGEKSRLIEIAERAFYAGIREIKPGARLGDLQNAIQLTTELNGFSIIRAMTGHGIGRDMHEEPSIPNYGRSGTGPILKKGMCLAIEPMIAAGTWDVDIDAADGWTCRTKDRRPAAHYENTVLVTDGGCEILTV